jgi:predicted nucleic acid-binding protein
MIPVVIDTNVFVAGLRSGGGASRAVLRRALGGGLQPLFGNALWMEYQDLLAFSAASLHTWPKWAKP